MKNQMSKTKPPETLLRNMTCTPFPNAKPEGSLRPQTVVLPPPQALYDLLPSALPYDLWLTCERPSCTCDHGHPLILSPALLPRYARHTLHNFSNDSFASCQRGVSEEDRFYGGQKQVRITGRRIALKMEYSGVLRLRVGFHFLRAPDV